MNLRLFRITVIGFGKNSLKDAFRNSPVENVGEKVVSLYCQEGIYNKASGNLIMQYLVHDLINTSYLIHNSLWMGHDFIFSSWHWVTWMLFQIINLWVWMIKREPVSNKPRTKLIRLYFSSFTGKFALSYCQNLVKSHNVTTFSVSTIVLFLNSIFFPSLSAFITPNINQRFLQEPLRLTVDFDLLVLLALETY